MVVRFGPVHDGHISLECSAEFSCCYQVEDRQNGLTHHRHGYVCRGGCFVRKLVNLNRHMRAHASHVLEMGSELGSDLE